MTGPRAIFFLSGVDEKPPRKGGKKTDFAALGGDLFLFLGYSWPCQVGDEVSFTCVTWMKIMNRLSIALVSCSTFFGGFSFHFNFATA